MDFLEKSIIELQNQRPIFHSEDDLKLALAFSIKKNNPEFEIRLERPVQLEMINRNGEIITVRAPIDIIVIDTNGNAYPIELKYKTKEAGINLNDENYILADHGAQDVGRYSFRKDIYRIENYKSKNLNYKYGYVLILTNDNKYFEQNVFETNRIDKHYSFHNGAKLNHFDLSWNFDKNDKTKEHWSYKKECFYKLDLLNGYKIKWEDYSKVKDTTFKYCLVKIE